MDSSIELNLSMVPDGCVKELERMFMDADTNFPCRIGKVTFNASVDGGEMVCKFLGEGGVNFSFHMNAGSFRIADPAETCPLDAIATMAKAMGWIAEESVIELETRRVVLRAVYGHANIPDLIVALDSGLLVYRLRVISAEPNIRLSNDGPIEETMTLKFGW